MSDLWQNSNSGAGGEAAGAIRLTTTANVTGGSEIQSSNSGISAAAAAAANSYNFSNSLAHHNNNYVNFNQFILQHNLIGNNGDAAGVDAVAAATGLEATTMPSPSSRNTMQHPFAVAVDYTAARNQVAPNNGYINNFTNGVVDTKPVAPASAAANQNFENMFTNPNIFQYNNGSDHHIAAGSVVGNAPTTAALGATTFYNNFYTPFENIGGVNYFANPFATGFDLNTNLQADAPEFVPSFAKLNLKDFQKTSKTEETKVSKQQNATPTIAVAAADSSVNDNGNEAATIIPTAPSTSRQSLFAAATNGNNNANNRFRPTNESHTTTNSNSGATSKQNYRAANNYTPTDRGGNGGGRQRGAGRRSMDYREDREDRYGNRFEKKPQKQQRYDNHRSNKRRDDWNRNRDRVNGFRVDDLDNSNESPLHSPDKKASPSKKNYVENEKLSQREKLIRDIEVRRLECLVCVEPIKSHHGVWSCHNCYHIMHLKCIITWASSSKSEEGWRCPACQNVAKEVPRDYYCFCGKQKNPQCNRQELAHSCGEVCCRIEGCQHACTLLCHPGPCPPCQANVQRSCGCGKTTKSMQCAMKEFIECGDSCDKLLNCEVHKCKEKCHEGKCPPCEEKVEQKCHCTKQERLVVCTRETRDKHLYSCGKPCGRDLACGNHKCKDCCHSGECRTCRMSPAVVTSCPCGKMPVLPEQRKSCLDAIPTCESVCSKTLRCGKSAHPHQCTSKCHLGNCPPCNKQTAIKCRCGHMDQMIKCRQLSTRADDARCKKRCTKKRLCGKHKCNQECCIDIDHVCPLPCNYTLSCGKHKCDQPCHRGNCPPCYRSSFEELYCECGAEVIMPPVPCGTKRPPCKKPCSRAHPCEHPPQHNCHSGPTCPPCFIFTTKWCYGHHEQRKTIPCSQESFSCGFACNKPLPCGRHKCIKPCHEGVCQAPGDICKQSCTTLRAQCGHKCQAPCHEGSCPDTPCKELVEVQCECGNRKQNRTCHELAREYSRIATAQLASSMAEMQRGNYMELSEILAPVKLNKTNKTLDCNDECKLLERNRRLAIGLQIRNPDAQQRQMTKYSEFVRNFAKRNPTMVKSIYDTLTQLVKLAKESKQKSRSHSFPTMNREKRQLVHELCEAFNVESVSYDQEPNRNVVATAYREKAWLPAASIMEVMQRESGQRRVPVPSNNAWGLKK